MGATSEIDFFLIYIYTKVYSPVFINFFLVATDNLAGQQYNFEYNSPTVATLITI